MHTRDEIYRLTAMVRSAGWASKVSSRDLAQVLGQLNFPDHPDLLVGFKTNDDAGVFRLNENMAIVQTVDFLTPMVDDPYTFGAIAAANAVSDLYAMGAKPLTGLNIVGFPVKEVPLTILTEILRGGADKAQEAGLVIMGGHTVDDAEPKFGMSVTGLISPDSIITNSGAKPGDRLILTKAIGTGIITTALKNDRITPADAADTIQSMLTLNRIAADIMTTVGVHACTDITGFGLLGHLWEMVNGSSVGARLIFDQVPLLPHTLDLARQEMAPGGSYKNLEYLMEHLQFTDLLEVAEQLVLADAQTSGGLLLSVSPGVTDRLVRALMANGILAAEIGEITNGPPRIEIVKKIL